MEHHQLNLDDDLPRPALLHLGNVNVRASATLTLTTGQVMEANPAGAAAVDLGLAETQWLIATTAFGGALGGWIAGDQGAVIGGAVGLLWGVRRWRQIHE